MKNIVKKCHVFNVTLDNIIPNELYMLEKWLEVNKKLPPKSGPSKPMWVKPDPSNLYIY